MCTTCEESTGGPNRIPLNPYYRDFKVETTIGNARGSKIKHDRMHAMVRYRPPIVENVPPTTEERLQMLEGEMVQVRKKLDRMEDKIEVLITVVEQLRGGTQASMS